MQIDLVELLGKTKIIHPTTIQSATLENGTLVLKLTGFAWWSSTKQTDAEYEFHFRNITDGVIDALLAASAWGHLHDEVLEYFEVTPMTDVGGGTARNRPDILLRTHKVAARGLYCAGGKARCPRRRKAAAGFPQLRSGQVTGAVCRPCC